MGQNTYDVSTTAVRVAEANTKRQSLWIANSGSSTIWLGPDNTVTPSTGNPLYGETHLLESKEAGNIYAGDYYAITSTGTSKVIVWEREK